MDFPEFLRGKVDEGIFLTWLHRKAVAHVQRDRKRGNESAGVAAYKRAIYAAILESRGNDCYTGKPLDWGLIGTFRNDEAKEGKRAYWKRFQDLPTIDHVDDGLGEPNFKICSQLTNDCKSHLSHEEFVQICRDVIAYHENLKGGVPS